MPALAAFDLVPGPGLTPTGRNSYAASGPEHTFTAASPLRPGWYRLRLRLHTPTRPGVRKSLDLAADAATLESFAWNETLREDLILKLPHAVEELKLTLRHAAGVVRIDSFTLGRVSSPRALARAVRLKVGLLTNYNCFWPVVKRGGRLLREGRVQEFGAKLFKGLSDARSMRPEVKQASEANAAWWRSRSLSTERAAELRQRSATLPDPPAYTVVVPVDATRVNYARHAVLAVCLQVYPHWRLVLAWAGKDAPKKLQDAARWDSRVAWVAGHGLADAVSSALATATDRVVVLPPDWELAEHCLYELAMANAHGWTADGSEVGACLRPRDALLAALADHSAGGRRLTASGFVQLAAAIPCGAAVVPANLAAPMNGGGHKLHAALPPVSGPPLVIGADVRGISGWDYLAYQMLSGLRSLGANAVRHPKADVRPDLVPPDLLPEKGVRGPNDSLFVVGPPFGLSRFKPDRRTACFTMWESTRLAAADVAELNKCGVVIVPSRWAVGCFRDSGVTVPIEVVPLGYEPLVFHPGPNTSELCTFGTAGALSAGGLRKNVGRVVELFRAAFPDETDVRLRVKITPNCPPFDIPDDPRVDVTRAALPHADLAAWNRSLTAYVNASHAEGFGLHLLEAMACGRPVIGPAYSGLTEFFDAAAGYAVPYRTVPANNAIYSGEWAEPDGDAIIAAMRRVYADRAECGRIGERAASRARRFTWRDCGRNLSTVLRRYGYLA